MKDLKIDMVKNIGFCVAVFSILSCCAMTELYKAAEAGDIARVQELIAAGADKNARDYNGWTPLYYAVFYRRPEVVQVLIDKGARIDTQNLCGLTPLHQAAYLGRLDIVKALIHAGANINARDNLGETPLHDAASYVSDLEVVQALIIAGANMSMRDYASRTPAQKARSHRKLAIADCIERAQEARVRALEVSRILARATHPRLARHEEGSVVLSALPQDLLHCIAHFTMQAELHDAVQPPR